MPQKVKVFVSYARKDDHLRKQLDSHLSSLKRQNYIDVWHDRNISAGQDWKQGIDVHLNNAQIVLLLVSAAFLASEYCYSIEMKRALARHKTGETCVIPIILRPVDWSGTPFSHIQALPTEAKPVTGRGWRNQDEAFADIAQGIRKIVEKLDAQFDHILLPEGEEKHQQIKPGGVWISPKDGEIIEDIVTFAAFAYPTNPDDPPIDHVNFTVGWHGYWQIASTIYPSDKNPVFTNDVNLSYLHLPSGELRVSFDVYDQKGNRNLAPNGVRTILYQPLQSAQTKVIAE